MKVATPPSSQRRPGPEPAIKAELFATERKARTRTAPFNGEAELKALTTGKTPEQLTLETTCG